MPNSITHEENIIEVKNVSFSYGKRDVLKHVQLMVHRGDYLGLVGGNGSGKTTLLKIILGLVKPDEGMVRLFGKDLATFKEWSRIGYVPQAATHFDQGFPATVEEVVLMGRFAEAGLFRSITKKDREKAHKALEAVGMQEYRTRLIGELSGGEKQRTFIARALAGEPEILFLDEPTVGVEKEVREDFYALLKKLNEEGLTVVLVTHDLENIAHEAMHVACLDCTLFFHDSAEEFLKNPSQGHAPHP